MNRTRFVWLGGSDGVEIGAGSAATLEAAIPYGCSIEGFTGAADDVSALVLEGFSVAADQQLVEPLPLTIANVLLGNMPPLLSLMPIVKPGNALAARIRNEGPRALRVRFVVKLVPL